MNESTTSAGTSTSETKPVHKWPIRPGVHVHVNGLHVLNNSNPSETTKISGFSYGARNNSTTASDTNLDKSGQDQTGSDETSRTNTVARGTSTSDMMIRHNETMAGNSNNNNAAPSSGGQSSSNHAPSNATDASGLINNSNHFFVTFFFVLHV